MRDYTSHYLMPIALGERWQWSLLLRSSVLRRCNQPFLDQRGCSVLTDSSELQSGWRPQPTLWEKKSVSDKKMQFTMRKCPLEQWSFTGGRHSSLAISVFLILDASSRERPLTRSVMYELDAMALPQPNVLNLTSLMIPSSSTRI